MALKSLRTATGVSRAALLLVGGLCSLGVVTPSEAAPIAASPSGTYSLVTYNTLGATPRCMDVAGGSSLNGANIQQWDCLGNGAQGFRLEPVSGGYYRLVNQNSGKCLDVEGWSTANGGNIGQWPCVAGQPNQEFLLEPSEYFYTLRNRHSGKCLDVEAWGTTNGTNIQQWDCLGNAAQRFLLVVSGSVPGYMSAINRHSGKCLDVELAGMGNGANVQQWECLGVNHQSFALSAQGVYQRALFRHSNMCLDVEANSTNNGANLWQWGCNGGGAQNFFAAQVDGYFKFLNQTSLRCADMGGWATNDGASLVQWECVHRGENQMFALAGSEVRMSQVHGGTDPRAVRLADGRLLGTFGGSDAGMPVTRLVLSSDNGRSWSDLGIASTGLLDEDMGNAFPLQLPSGRLLVAVRHHTYNTPGDISQGTYRIRVRYSDDLGVTWNQLSEVEINQGSKQSAGIWEPFLYLASDGSLHVYYAKEWKGNNDQDIVMRRSMDGGLTWGPIVTVATQSGRRDGMPSVARLADGSLMAVFESLPNGAGIARIDRIISTDNGSTWGSRAPIYAGENDKVYVGAPFIISLPNGRLVASFMRDDIGPVLSTPEKREEYPDLRIVATTTGGITSSSPISWSSMKVVSPPRTYWPSLYSLNNGANEFLQLYERSGWSRTQVGTVSP